MRQFKIIPSRCEHSSGKLGLALEGINIREDVPFVAFDGRLIAHDIIEHTDGIKDTIENEFHALGAGFFCRGQYGAYQKNGEGRYSAGEILFNEVLEFFQQVADKVYTFDVINLDDSPDFHRPGRYASEQMMDVFESHLDEETGLDEKTYPGFSAELSSVLGCPLEVAFKSAAYYIGQGFGMAEEVYRSGQLACTLFWEIAARIEGILKRGIDLVRHIDVEFDPQSDFSQLKIKIVEYDYA